MDMPMLMMGDTVLTYPYPDTAKNPTNASCRSRVPLGYSGELRLDLLPPAKSTFVPHGVPVISTFLFAPDSSESA